MSNKEFYVAKNKDNIERLKSQSGGMFSVVSDYYLKNDGVIYGCVLDEKFEVYHTRATKKNERDKMLLSKYTQSDLKNVYNEVKNDLLNDKKVLFSGTPCQVNGLKSFLNKSKVDISNLLLIDIICHGVPSQGVWKDFLSYLEKKHKSKISNIIFRNKKYGWHSSVLTYEINHKEYKDNSYSTLFYLHYIIRPSCFRCPFRTIERSGDITIGDAWGNQKKYADFFDNDGVSLLIINNEKGSRILNSINEFVDIKPVDIEDFKQQALKSNYNYPKKYDRFWEDYKTHNYKYIARKYGGNNIFVKTKRFIKRIYKKVFNK